MTSSIFPDLNAWLALTVKSHQHHDAAWAWYKQLRKGQMLGFCRTTQMGLLRLLTNSSAVGVNVRTQVEAWAIYDGWLSGGGVVYLEEPLGIDVEFRFYTNRPTPWTKEWADSYLVAFVAAASLDLVTFDRALSQRYARSILLTA